MDNDSTAALYLGMMIGLLLGVAVTAIACVASYEHELSGVGIDRIEYCHNVQSNWYEIVWANESEVKE